MDNAEVLRHVFEAMSSLSDADDVLANYQDTETALGRIDHAKRHLQAVLDADRELLEQVLRFMPLVCSLTDSDMLFHPRGEK